MKIVQVQIMSLFDVMQNISLTDSLCLYLARIF